MNVVVYVRPTTTKAASGKLSSTNRNRLNEGDSRTDRDDMTDREDHRRVPNTKVCSNIARRFTFEPLRVDADGYPDRAFFRDAVAGADVPNHGAVHRNYSGVSHHHEGPHDDGITDPEYRICDRIRMFEAGVNRKDHGHVPTSRIHRCDEGQVEQLTMLVDHLRTEIIEQPKTRRTLRGVVTKLMSKLKVRVVFGRYQAGRRTTR